MALLIWFTGCASLPGPYVGPEANASPEQRLALAQKYYIHGNIWEGYRIGQNAWPSSLWQLQDYYQAMGNEEAQAKARSASLWDLSAVGLDLGSLFFLPAIVQGNNGAVVGFWSALGLGLGSEILGFNKMVDSVSSFNAKLLRDAGLPPDAMPVPDPQSPNPQSRDASAFYFQDYMGWEGSTGQDMQDFFQPKHGTYPYNNLLRLGLGGGNVLDSGFTLEYGFEMALSKGGGISYNNAANDQRGATAYIRSIYAAPGWTWGLRWPLQDRESSFLAGCRLGGSEVLAEQSALNNVGSTGSYIDRGYNFYYSPYLRWQIPLNKTFSYGLEAGYQFSTFNYLVVSDSQGIFTGLSSPDLNRSGQPGYWDFSGPYLCLSMELGKLPFTR